MILSVTGHRPDKLGGYHDAARLRLHAFALDMLRAFEPAKVVTGMAIGWDNAVAHACLGLGIPFVAAVPFVGQERRWNDAQREDYAFLLERAAESVVVCSGGFSPAKMQHRNEWMVDNSDMLLALWNGTSGGTHNCVRYAHRKRRIVANVWDRWEVFP